MNVKSIVTRSMELTIEGVLILDIGVLLQQVEGELHDDNKAKAFVALLQQSRNMIVLPEVGHTNVKSMVTRSMDLTMEEVLILDNMPWPDVVQHVEGELHKDNKAKAFIVRT